MDMEVIAEENSRRCKPVILPNLPLDRLVQEYEARHGESPPFPWRIVHDEEVLDDECLGYYRGIRVRGRSRSRLNSRSRR